MVLLVFVCLVEPLRVGFDLRTEPGELMFAIDIALDLFFAIDLFLQFFTSFPDPITLMPVTELRRVVKKYLSWWFWVDLLSVFPFQYLLRPWESTDPHGSDASRSLRFARFPRLFKLVRIARVKRILERYAEIMPRMRALLLHYDLVKLLFKIFMCGHIMACLWNFVGDINEECWQDDTCPSWQKGKFGELRLEEARVSVAGDGCRLPYVDVAVGDNSTCINLGQRYTYSFYWAFTTISTVGYGDISATNPEEMWLSVASMIIGVQIFTTVASTVAAIVETANAGQNAADRRISTIMRSLRQRKVSAALRDDIRDFYTIKYRNHETPEVDMGEIVKELPPTLSRDLSEHLYSKYWKIKSMAFWHILMFSRTDEKDQQALCRLLSPMILRANSFVFEQGQSYLGIYVIVRGKIKLHRMSGESIYCAKMGVATQNSKKSDLASTSGHNDDSLFSYIYDAGDCFGEIETLSEIFHQMDFPGSSLSIPRYGFAEVTTLRGAEVLCLDDAPPKAALRILRKHHPEVLERFGGLASVREEKICQRMHVDLKAWVRRCFDDSFDGTNSTEQQPPQNRRGVSSFNPDLESARTRFEDTFIMMRRARH
jgi:CRP-like cAMP-binding protein